MSILYLDETPNLVEPNATNDWQLVKDSVTPLMQRLLRGAADWNRVYSSPTIGSLVRAPKDRLSVDKENK